MLFLYRPGSVEVTSALIVPHQNNIAGVREALDIYNKSGIIGNMSWIALYWGPEGEMPCSVVKNPTLFCVRLLFFVDNFIASQSNLKSRSPSPDKSYCKIVSHNVDLI